MQGKSLRRGEQGQGLVEYALILVLVAIVVIVILATMGPAISDAYCGIVLELNPAGECTAAVAENNEQQQPQQQEEEEEEQQPSNMSYSHDWGGCTNTCTNSYLTCPQGHQFRFTTSAYPNGDPGMTSVRTCSAGPTGFGNFFSGQTLTFEDLTAGGTLTVTLGPIGS